MENIIFKNLTEKDNEENKQKLECHAEPDDSLLLFGRASNPVIKEKFIDLMVEAINKKGEQKKTRDEIKRDYEKRLQKIKKDTPISFNNAKISRVDPDSKREIIAMTPYLEGEEKGNKKAMAITEAHEKDHVLRPLNLYCEFFDDYFGPAIDTSVITCKDKYAKRAEESCQDIKKYLEKDFDYRALAKEQISRYLNRGFEIEARMSQLKNYFGFTGDEIFTKEHLDYAKENYVKDTGFDNLMTHFFEAITPETEEKFLELINKSGI
ncbi:MAG: hypothetical protein Q8N55_01075 [bacterium]|nr:hypothetical protein [bacterium]